MTTGVRNALHGASGNLHMHGLRVWAPDPEARLSSTADGSALIHALLMLILFQLEA